MKGTTVTTGDGDYKFLQVRVVALGTLMKSEQLEPPVFGLSDTYQVWLSRELV